MFSKLLHIKLLAMKKNQRNYPIGVQTFSEIRKEGCVYIDKTDLVWKLKNAAKYVFLSRPRRFGKSLLSTTLVSYFRGEQHLFEGLKIMELEKEWKSYPVLHLDISTAKNKDSKREVLNELHDLIEPYCNVYGVDMKGNTPGQCLKKVITNAYRQTGTQVVVVIDEYDAPLLDVIHDDNLIAMRKVMQEFYQPLKACESMVKFCFITGITKFSQLSIFSTINNILNVSMLSQFSAICGITDTELTTTLADDIHAMALEMELTDEEMHMKLKQQYDGYHFSSNSEDIYNPFSLLNAFATKKTSNYWFSSGTPTFLVEQMKNYKVEITDVENVDLQASAFDAPTDKMDSIFPLLYQSGYLTIKEYDSLFDTYRLAIPNQEVRVGLTECLLPAVSGINLDKAQSGFGILFARALWKDDIETALDKLDAFLESLPYIEGFKQKLNDAQFREGFYEYTFFLIFSMLEAYVQTQVKRWRGRIDMVVQTPTTIYLFEFKLRDNADKAILQMDERHFVQSYKTENRRIVKVGIRFDTESWSIKERKVE